MTARDLFEKWKLRAGGSRWAGIRRRVLAGAKKWHPVAQDIEVLGGVFGKFPKFFEKNKILKIKIRLLKINIFWWNFFIGKVRFQRSQNHCLLISWSKNSIWIYILNKMWWETVVIPRFWSHIKGNGSPTAAGPLPPPGGHQDPRRGT